MYTSFWQWSLWWTHSPLGHNACLFILIVPLQTASPTHSLNSVITSGMLTVQLYIILLHRIFTPEWQNAAFDRITNLFWLDQTFFVSIKPFNFTWDLFFNLDIWVFISTQHLNMTQIYIAWLELFLKVSDYRGTSIYWENVFMKLWRHL